MSRPSRNIDRLLLNAGKKLVPKTGFSGLKIREVARAAGVNPGMFNYHFGTKERFIECLLTEMYEEFFSSLRVEAGAEGDCRAQFRSALVTIACFLRDHRDMIGALLEEILIGNRKIMEFVRKNMTRHFAIVFALMADCQRQGYFRKAPVMEVLPFIMGSVAGPIIMARFVEKFGGQGLVEPAAVRSLEKAVLADAEIGKRIDMALRGLEAR